MGRRSSIDDLPEEVRRWLERALMDSNFSGYAQLVELLGEKGFILSKSAIHRFGQKIEKRFATIKASTEAARMLTEGAADDQDARSSALIALVQTELFEHIVNLQEASEAKDVAKRIDMLSKAARNIATLSRASVNLKQFQSEVRARAQTAANNVEKLARQGGLSSETVSDIRRQILGVAS